MKLNLFKIFTYVVFFISSVVTILLPKSIYGLLIFTLLHMIGIICLLLVSKVKQRPVFDTLEHEDNFYNNIFRVIAGVIFFLSLLTINRYLNAFRIDKSLENFPLIIAVFIESVVITALIQFIVKLINKQITNFLVWKIILNAFIFLGLIASIIIGPLIQSYHTDWIIHIHIVFSLCVAIPGTVLLFLTYFIETISKPISYHQTQ